MTRQFFLLFGLSVLSSSCILKWLGKSESEVKAEEQSNNAQQMRVYDMFRKFDQIAIGDCDFSQEKIRDFTYHSDIVRYLARRDLFNEPSGVVLTIPEFVSIATYTADGFEAYNKALTGDQKCQPLLDFAHVTAQGLKRLPKTNGTIFSGAPVSFMEMRTRYAENKNVDENQFRSASHSFNTAQGFAFSSDPNSVSVVFEINGTGGRDISAISHFSAEKEVLVGPGARYHVDSSKSETSPQGEKFQRIKMTRLDDGGQLPAASGPLVPFTKSNEADLDSFVLGFSEFFVKSLEEKLKESPKTPKDDFVVVQTADVFSIKPNIGGIEFSCNRKPTVRCLVKATVYTFDDFQIFMSPLVPGDFELFTFNEDVSPLEFDGIMREALSGFDVSHPLEKQFSCGTSSFRKTNEIAVSRYGFCVFSRKQKLSFLSSERAPSLKDDSDQGLE